jgi:hypothetical protein
MECVSSWGGGVVGWWGGGVNEVIRDLCEYDSLNPITIYFDKTEYFFVKQNLQSLFAQYSFAKKTYVFKQ